MMRESTLKHFGGAGLLLPLFILAGACDSPVTTSPPAAVEVHAPTEAMHIGQSYQFEARALDDAGGQLQEPMAFTWTSSDPGIASVSTTGQVTAHAHGFVRITAAAGAVEGWKELWVTRVAAVSVLPPLLPGGMEAALAVGRSMPVRVITYALPGATADDLEIVLTSSDPSILAVNPDGTVSGVAVGTVTLTAAVEGVEGTMEVVVERGYDYVEIDGYVDDLNDAGWLVGRRGDRGILWRDGEVIDLGLAGVLKTAVGNGGDVVGTYQAPGSTQVRPFRWRDGVVSDLTMGDDVYGAATDVNAAGLVVGYSRTDGVYRSRAWDAAGNPVQLPEEPDFGQALGVNDSGDIVGFMGAQAYVIRGGARTLLPGLRATFIRNDGLVLGMYRTELNGAAAAIFQNGTRTTMIDPPRHTSAIPAAMNSEDHAVGTASHGFGGPGPAGWVWHDGRAKSLTYLLRDEQWTVLEANAINESGAIAVAAVRGTWEDPEHRSLILTPRP